MRKIIIGETYPTRQGQLKVLHKVRGNIYNVEFVDSKYKATATSSNILAGKVKDYSKPTAHGQGILGAKPTPEDKEVRKVWQDLLKRAYSRSWSDKYGTYSGVTISDEWKQFEKFREHYKKHYRKGWQLDKDLLVPNNKVYSKETTVYLPQDINKAIMSVQGSYIDVKLGTRVAGKKFKAIAKIDGNIKQLGTFDTIEEAHTAWLKSKIDTISTLTKKHNGSLSGKAKKGLKNLTKRLGKML